MHLTRGQQADEQHLARGRTHVRRRTAPGLLTAALVAMATATVASGLPAVAAPSGVAAASTAATVTDPASHVDPFVGTANAGNTFPGAVAPFGMFSLSPQQLRYNGPTSGADAGRGTMRTTAPSGYEYNTNFISGFGLSHVSGAGCSGIAGDVPIMPITTEVTTSPSAADATSPYRSTFSHADESASPGSYAVRLGSGVEASMAAANRSGMARFAFPTTGSSGLLVRSSDSLTGSSDATLTIDKDRRTVSGSVTSGNFCGPFTGDGILQKSYYTLHFTMSFDQPFQNVGTWRDGTVTPDSVTAHGGTGYAGGLSTSGGAANGYAPAGKGSGGYLMFAPGSTVNARIGISYVSDANAAANLAAETPDGTSLPDVQAAARTAWNEELGRIAVGGGTEDQLSTFYSALYHSLLHPNLASDINGEYVGMDRRTHVVRPGQKAQYATFSGWDVYRSQVQLVTLLDPKRGSDIATSLLNQAVSNGGVWDRWTHNSGGTHVMVGDPSAAALAGILAFGGTDFPVKESFTSLAKAARTPTADDFSRAGWNVAVLGQRPSLDQFLDKGYYPDGCNAWGCPNETLEMAAADHGLAMIAEHLGDTKSRSEFLQRSQAWQQQFNPKATTDGGYVQSRLANGSWVSGFDPGSSYGFVEGTGAQYVWMVQHNPAGLFDAMGGSAKAIQRLDRFFKDADGNWVLVGPWDGNTHANMDNEPSIGAAWLYDYAGAPWKTQETVRQTIKQLWLDTKDGTPGGPDGIPGNDDLGQMSSWLVFAALGLYPQNPSRGDLAMAAPLFPTATIHRANGVTLTVNAPGADLEHQYVRSMRVGNGLTSRNYLPASALSRNTTVDFELSTTPVTNRGTKPSDAPPSSREGESPYVASISSPTTTAVPGGLTRAVTLDVHRMSSTAPKKLTYAVHAEDGLVPVVAGADVEVGSSGDLSVPVTLRVPEATPLGTHAVTVTTSAGGRPLDTLTFDVVVATASKSVLGTSFEPGQPQPQQNVRLESSGLSEYCCGIGGTETKAQGGFGATGSWSLIYSARATAPDNHASNVILDTDAPVAAGDVLSYAVQPQATGGPFAGWVQNASQYVAVDLLFTDGTRLSDTGVVTSNGEPLDPTRQGAVLTPDTWNRVQVSVPEAADGKSVDKVLLRFGTGSVVATTGQDDGYLRGWVDDVTITRAIAPLTVTGSDGVGAVVKEPTSPVMASFTGGIGEAAGDYTASIAWGDRTAPSTGTIARADDGSYTVTGTHTYGRTGSFSATVTVTDGAGVSKQAQVPVAVAKVLTLRR